MKHVTTMVTGLALAGLGMALAACEPGLPPAPEGIGGRRTRAVASPAPSVNSADKEVLGGGGTVPLVVVEESNTKDQPPTVRTLVGEIQGETQPGSQPASRPSATRPIPLPTRGAIDTTTAPAK